MEQNIDNKLIPESTPQQTQTAEKTKDKNHNKLVIVIACVLIIASLCGFAYPLYYVYQDKTADIGFTDISKLTTGHLVRYDKNGADIWTFEYMRCKMERFKPGKETELKHSDLLYTIADALRIVIKMEDGKEKVLYFDSENKCLWEEKTNDKGEITRIKWLFFSQYPNAEQNERNIKGYKYFRYKVAFSLSDLFSFNSSSSESITQSSSTNLEQQLIGTWYYGNISTYESYKFNADGTYSWCWSRYSPDTEYGEYEYLGWRWGAGAGEGHDGTWKIENEILILDADDIHVGKIHQELIVSFNGNNLDMRCIPKQSEYGSNEVSNEACHFTRISPKVWITATVKEPDYENGDDYFISIGRYTLNDDGTFKYDDMDYFGTSSNWRAGDRGYPTFGGTYEVTDEKITFHYLYFEDELMNDNETYDESFDIENFIMMCSILDDNYKQKDEETADRFMDEFKDVDQMWQSMYQ